MTEVKAVVLMYVLGLDVGTQGARAMVCDAQGNVVAQAARAFAAPKTSAVLPHGFSEQDPEDWWAAASGCLCSLINDLRKADISPARIKGIAVDSTSGTIVPLDRSGTPLRPAIMYNDTRAVFEAQACNSAGQVVTDKLGYKFSSSFSLPKLLWLKTKEPEVFDNTAYLAHAADYLVGRLTGRFGISDTSNALKTGYDMVDGCWPEFIESVLGIPDGMLPEVAAPGTEIASISEACALETGLAAGTPVVAGVTDGTAGFLASGAVEVGDWNSTIGTTLVMRGVSKNLIKDPQGRFYCHSHPQGYWLPGGASNVGAECLTKLFHGRDLGELDAYVPQYSPTSLLVYPLVRAGERMPFVDPHAEGFIIGEPRDSRDLYAAYLEGVGFVERWCFEVLSDLGAVVGDTIYTTGGGAKSSEWMQIRADILNRSVVRPLSTECAMGAAAVAASSTLYSDLSSAVQSMVKLGESMQPDPIRVESYNERYAIFRGACTQRGYE